MTYFGKTAICIALFTVGAAGCRVQSRTAPRSADPLWFLFGNSTGELSAFESIVLSEIAYRNGNLKAAVGHMRAARDQDDDAPDIALRLAELYLEMGLSRSATEEIDTVLTSAPRHKEGWLLRSKAARKTGDVTAALAAAEQVLVLCPRHLDGAVWLSSLLTEARRFEEAVAVLSQALRYHPGNPRLSAELMLSWLSQGNYPAARRVAHQVAARGRLGAPLWVQLGRSAMEAGHPAAAAADFETAFAVSPPSEALRLELIDIYLSTDNLRQARHHLYALPPIDEAADPSAYLARAARWHRAGQPFDARRVLLLGMADHPDHAGLTLALAAVEMHLARLEAAARILSRPAMWPRDQLLCRDTLRAALSEWPNLPPLTCSGIGAPSGAR